MQRYFKDRKAWRRWLEANHDTAKVLWLVFYKKHTHKPSMPYDDAVEEAICFGWIDSIVKRLDDERYLRKFTPRTNTSNWSAANRKRLKKLKAAGLMTQAGLAKIAPGTKAPSPSPESVEMPAFFAEALAQNAKARKSFERLAPSRRRYFIYWLASAKREQTQQRRLTEAISLLTSGHKLPMK